MANMASLWLELGVCTFYIV